MKEDIKLVHLPVFSAYLPNAYGMDLISVIIPTHCPGDYLYNCLDSIEAQELRDVRCEVLVVLNGLKEPYFENLSRWIKGNKNTNISYRPEFIEQAHVSDARNYGLDLAKGEYIVFMDDDDRLSSNFIQSLYSRSDGTSVVFGNVRNFRNEPLDAWDNYLTRDFCRNSPKGEASWWDIRSHMSLVWGKMIPACVIGSCRFHPAFKNGQDALFMALISKNITNIKLSTEDAIYYWRVRENSASRKKTSLLYEFRNACNLSLAYMKIYTAAPTRYNLLYFAGRPLAVFKRFLYKVANYYRWKSASS